MTIHFDVEILRELRPPIVDWEKCFDRNILIHFQILSKLLQISLECNSSNSEKRRKKQNQRVRAIRICYICT